MKRLNADKKGQLTIFIIVGIVLLFSTALVVYIQRQVESIRPAEEIIAETVTGELQPVHIYVTDCMKTIAKEAIAKAGAQGGHLDTDGLIFNEQDPTESDGISMYPGSEIKIPYWFYMKSRNTCTECTFKDNQPILYRRLGGASLEQQIDDYVELRIGSCINSFAGFSNQMSIKEGNAEAKTTIAKTSVFVQLEYPLEVTFSDGRKSEISKFTVQIPVNLGKYYDLSAEIKKNHAQNNFLGFFAINLIDAYAAIDKEKLPPIGDTSLLSGEERATWDEAEVKKRIERLLSNYVQGIQTAGTLNYVQFEGGTDIQRGTYLFFVLPLNGTYETEAGFTYLDWWPSYLHVTPQTAGLIEPSSATVLNPFLSFLGITQYKFAYDLSYPVLVSISDEEGLDGDPFTFNIALEANLRDNKPLTVDSIQVLSAQRTETTQVCNKDNFQSGLIEISAKESITNLPVEDALVYFSFGDESCLIGKTELKNGRAILESSFPVGLGTLVVTKDGYSSKSMPFYAKLEVTKKQEIILDRYVELEATVKKVPFTKKCRPMVGDEFCVWLPGEKTELESFENAVVSLIKINDNEAEEDYVESFQIDEENRKGTIKLVPGKYSISASLIDTRKTIIPQEEICYPDDWYDTINPFGGEKCEWIPKDGPTEMNQLPKGGVEIDSVEIFPEELNGAKGIELYLFASPDGYTRDENGVTNLKHEDLEESGKALDEYSKNYYLRVLPRFIK